MYREIILPSVRTRLNFAGAVSRNRTVRPARRFPWLLAGLLTLASSAAAAPGFQELPDLSGNWIRGDFAGLGRSNEPLEPAMLTVDGQRGMDAYDFLTDDPAYECVPASWARVWSNPNVVVQIDQSDRNVRLRYEWMDIDRRIPLSDPADPNAERVHMEGIPTLGRSMAWYDGDTLVIDTVDYAPGYVTTIANLAGLPQSRTMHTVERIRREGEGLVIEITHLDPTIIRRPFVMSISYAPTNFELLDYGCSPEYARIVAPDD